MLFILFFKPTFEKIEIRIFKEGYKYKVFIVELKHVFKLSNIILIDIP